MMNYVEAVKTILENISPLESEEKNLSNIYDQVLAEDIYSDVDIPAYNTSGPDGYAVKSEDIQGADREHPVTLRIIETVRAGYLSRRAVRPYTAVRIMTGSVLPEGADCVVRFEDTDEPADKNGPNAANPSHVKIYVSLEPGANITRAGNNTRKGSLVIPRGTVIGPAQLLALTAIGRTRVRVFRRPAAAVIATGDELVRPGKPLSPGKSYECNSAAVKALVRHYGGTCRLLGIARDKRVSLVSKITKGLEADAIITSGGVSKGDYDLVRLVLGEMGRVVFSRVNLGPGASFAFGLCNRPSNNGRSRQVPVFALSGPSAGCLNNFEILVRPALLKMRGLPVTEHPLLDATVEDAVSSKKGMGTVKWTRVERDSGGYRVKLNGSGGALASLANGNSITIIPEGADIRAGDKIQVMPLDWTR